MFAYQFTRQNSDNLKSMALVSRSVISSHIYAKHLFLISGCQLSHRNYLIACTLKRTRSLMIEPTRAGVQHLRFYNTTVILRGRYHLSIGTPMCTQFCWNGALYESLIYVDAEIRWAFLQNRVHCVILCHGHGINQFSCGWSNITIVICIGICASDELFYAQIFVRFLNQM